MDARDLEVRCASCDAGFAVGTRRCIHCGQALGARSGAALEMSAESEEDGAEQNPLRSLRSTAVMLAIVLISALVRACS